MPEPDSVPAPPALTPNAVPVPDPPAAPARRTAPTRRQSPPRPNAVSAWSLLRLRDRRAIRTAGCALFVLLIVPCLIWLASRDTSTARPSPQSGNQHMPSQLATGPWPQQGPSSAVAPPKARSQVGRRSSRTWRGLTVRCAVGQWSCGRGVLMARSSAAVRSARPVAAPVGWSGTIRQYRPVTPFDLASASLLDNYTTQPHFRAAPTD